jgi:hypothetical protein
MTNNNGGNFQDMKRRAMQLQQSNMGSIAPNILPGVKPDDLNEIKCKFCQGETFYPAHFLKFASRFQSRNGQPTLVQFPVGFACASCGQVNPFDATDIGGTDKDGQKSKAQQEKKDEPGGDLGISVQDGTKTSEKLG